MNILLFLQLSSCICVALALTTTTGCANQIEKAPPVSECPSTYSFRYVDPVHGFSLCLPANVKKGDASDFPTDSVVFTNFAVPAKSNLQAKELIIVPGKYDMLQSATAFGHFTAGGVTFNLLKAEEGSAGHLTLHIIYTWKRGSQEMEFDFAHRSVNVANFDPSNRPKEYSQAGQVKLTEQIMSTFKPLH
jgi:hypothetical protein